MMGIYNKKALAMEEYCLRDELEFLRSLKHMLSGNLREKIDNRIGSLSARLRSLKENQEASSKD